MRRSPLVAFFVLTWGLGACFLILPPIGRGLHQGHGDHPYR